MKTKYFSSMLVLLISALLICSILVTGCSSPKTTTPTTTTSAPVKTTTPVTTPTTTGPQYGGTLKIIMATSPSGLGYVPDILKPEYVEMVSPAAETLFRTDAEGTSHPFLAADYLKYDSATNSYTLKIKQGIKFHDGTDFNAEAVKWNLDQSIGQRTDVKNVASVDVIDEYTCRINMSVFDNTVQDQLCRYCGLMFSPTYFKTNGHEATKNYPVGTGPFKFVSFTRDVDLKYTRWDGYWQEGKPYLPDTVFTKYYFHSRGNASTRNGSGTLNTQVPDEEPYDVYLYDPRNPTPIIGGISGCDYVQGAFDQQEVEARSDVLVYTSPVLETDIEVTGPIEVVLWAASSAVDTDFTGKLVDVWPDGRAYNLVDGIVRARYRKSEYETNLLKPGKIYQISFNLGSTSNVFKAGHRIRFQIASSAFPKWDRNLNTGHPVGQDSEINVAVQTIYHDKQHPSHIVLPVIPRSR